MTEFLPDKNDRSRVDAERTSYPGYNGTTIDLPALFSGNSSINTVGRFETQSAPAQVYRNNRDSVAHINTLDGTTATGSTLTTDGSGFFVNQDGVLATDYHVIKDARGRISVTTSDGRVHNARILDVDTTHDLALLQVQPVQPGETFKPVVFGSSQVAPNDTVTALGFPKTSDVLHVSPGNNTTQTTLSRFSLDGGLMPGEDPNRRVLTTDMNVQKGNSGGPLFDSSGRVVGVIDLNGSRNNVASAFAVATPSEDLLNLLNRNRIGTGQTYVADNRTPYYGPQQGGSFYPQNPAYDQGQQYTQNRFYVPPERQQQLQRDWGNTAARPGYYSPDVLPQLPRVNPVPVQSLSPMQVLDQISSLQTLQRRN